jgi:protein associated with RNAse G/E
LAVTAPINLLNVGDAIAVKKFLYDGKPSYVWDGTVVAVADDHVVIEALFTRGSRDLGYVVLEPGDVFIEFYYYEQWFNIFQIYSAAHELKGWYCNIGRPPEIKAGELRYLDLALDLFVYPDRRELVLDEDEFEELRASTYLPEDTEGALKGLIELQSWSGQGRLPSRLPATG